MILQEWSVNHLGKLWNSTFVRFMLVGLVNTGIGTAVMFLLYWLGAGYWLSSAANYVVGSIVSFFLNKYFTFRNQKRSFKQVLFFAVHIAVCYFIAYGVAKPVGYWLLPGASVENQETVAMLMAMGLFVMLNYLGQRFLVFSDKRSKK